MSKVTSCGTLNDVVMSGLGIIASCDDDNHRDYAGVPAVSGSGKGWFLTPGKQSKCSGSTHGSFRPLCFCDPAPPGRWYKGEFGSTCQETCDSKGKCVFSVTPIANNCQILFRSFMQ